MRPNFIYICYNIKVSYDSDTLLHPLNLLSPSCTSHSIITKGGNNFLCARFNETHARFSVIWPHPVIHPKWPEWVN